jgi:hypothetical protein
MSSEWYVRNQSAWKFIALSNYVPVLPNSTITHGSQIPTAYASGLIGLNPSITLTPAAAPAYMNDGDVYENLDITGFVIISANNVTFRNCRITNTNAYRTVENGVSSTRFANISFYNCEINGNGGDAGIAGHNLTVVRTVFKQSLKDLQIGDNILIAECMMNDHVVPPVGAHTECVLRNSGTNLVVQRSYMVYEKVSDGVSSAISAYEQPDCYGFVLEDSYVAGGGYAVYAGANGGRTTGVKIRGNIFGRDIQRYSGWAGPIDTTGRDTPGWEFTNNTWGARGASWQTGDPEAGALVVI